MNQQTEKMPTFFRFEDLRIYHKALDYICWVQEISSMMPDNDRVDFIRSFNNAARQIALNIAEGSARNKAQFVYHLKISKSAIRECLVYTTLAYKNNLLTDSHNEESRNQLMEMTKMLGALITSLQRSGSSSHDQDDE